MSPRCAASARYHDKRERYSLAHDGTELEVTCRAHILVPNIALIAGLHNHLSPSGAVDTATECTWQGMRHYDIANVRSLYYDEDGAYASWEVDAWGRLDEFAHGRLWQLFETFLTGRFPGATRVFTD